MSKKIPHKFLFNKCNRGGEFMFKKIFSVICVVVSVLCFGLVASAESFAPFTLYTDSASSTLTISGTTATCTSKATGYVGTTTKIVIQQTLQKKTSSGTWSKVNGWSETDSGYKGSATNKEYNLTSGTYRLKTVFTVYAESNSEVVEKLSKEITI